MLRIKHTFLLPCLVHRSFTWTLWRSVSLACGLSVSAVKAPSTRMCSAPGTYSAYMDYKCVFTVGLLCKQWQYFMSCNTVPSDSPAAGTVPSFTWGKRFRKIWMTRASWCHALDGDRHGYSSSASLSHCICYSFLMLVKIHIYQTMSMFSKMNKWMFSSVFFCKIKSKGNVFLGCHVWLLLVHLHTEIWTILL